MKINRETKWQQLIGFILENREDLIGILIWDDYSLYPASFYIEVLVKVFSEISEKS